MRRNQGVLPLWILGLFSLGLLLPACQPSSADTSSEAPTEHQPSGAGRSGPLSKEFDRSSSSEKTAEIREVTYVAEKIKPVPAQLVSKEPNSRINVRSHPSTRSKAKHFGYQGDAVTLLQKAKGEGDALWYYLRFEQSKAEGWIREDFISRSSVAILPKQHYRPYNFETDPWLSSFNKTYAAAKQRQEAWLFNAPTVALRLTGYPNSDGCQPTEVNTIEHSANRIIVVVKSGPPKKDHCGDDSVLASEIRVDLVKENQLWTIEWAGGRYRCHPRRGQQDFAPTLCS